MLSDIIHRQRAPLHDADELEAHVRACDLARAAGAPVPADIDPETYRGALADIDTEEHRAAFSWVEIPLDRRRGPGSDRRRRVPPSYSLPGQ